MSLSVSAIQLQLSMTLYFTAEFSHTGHEHRAEGKSPHESVGQLVCEHTDLLEIPDYGKGLGDECESAGRGTAAELLV
jgi:hypothetical protein